MSSRRPEGNTKVVFTSWKSLWDTIRETKLTEDERALVENTSVAGFVQSQNARRQTYVFKNEKDYVPLNGDALTDVTASIVGVGGGLAVERSCGDLHKEGIMQGWTFRYHYRTNDMYLWTQT